MKSDPNLNSGFFVKNKNEDNLENLFSNKIWVSKIGTSDFQNCPNIYSF